jgi:hypothetical protein
VESRFGELLLSLSRQTLRASEFVIVDNFSTREKLRNMTNLLASVKGRYFGDRTPVRLVPITDSEFSHAYSTNAGVFVAQNDLVCVTNGHSLPASDTWLESGVSHFEDPRVAGVGGYSIPHEDGTIWEKLAIDWGWRRLNESSKAYAKDSYFSTTNCVFRRRLWEEYAFDERLPSEVPPAGRFGGEDHDWACEMLARGHKIVVEPGFCVLHSHGENLSTLFSKYFAWRQVRKRVRRLQRPRESYTRVRDADLEYVTV